MEWVQNVARSLGYVIVTKRTKTKSSGYVSKVILMCDRGGEYKSCGTSSRNTGTKKINCPFELCARYSKRHDTWTLEVVRDEHNHESAAHMEGHPFARRLTQDEKRLVEHMTMSHVKPSNILATLKTQNEQNVSTIKTIYNARDRIWRSEQGDRSQMQLAFSFLQKKKYIFYYRANEMTNELEDLFFVHPTSLMIWRAFPLLLVMDATYKTNKYNMPFFEIVGVTSTNTTFSIAYVFMDREHESNYTWALTCLKMTMEGNVGPCVILTDRELALMNACENVFPEANRLLCRWHIWQCILKHCRPRVKSQRSWDLFNHAWDRLLDSPTRAAFSQNYDYLQAIVSDFPGVIEYVSSVWLDKYKEMFVSAWSNRVLNYHNHTTNRVESQHARLKSCLCTPNATLYKLFNCIDDLIHSQYTELKGKFEVNKIINKHRYETKYFANLIGKVSHHALDKIFNELSRSNALELTEENCGCDLRNSCGLPCAHELVILLNQNSFIPLNVIDKFWRKLDFLPYDNIQDDEINYEPVLEEFIENYKTQSKAGKVSYLQKLKGIFDPSSIFIAAPTVRKNTRGRPRESTKQPKTSVVDLFVPQVIPSQEPARHTSFSFREPTMHQPERHSSSTFREPIMHQLERHRSFSVREPFAFEDYFAHEPVTDNFSANHDQPRRDMNLFNPLLSALPHEFHRYITNIHDVMGDGNCGFRSVAVCLGLPETSWLEIRKNLLDEILLYQGRYAQIFEQDLNRVTESLNYFESLPAPPQHWMIMPDTGLLIANKYGVIVHYIAKEGSLTLFPLWYGPSELSTHVTFAIGHVYGCHYVKLDLLEGYPWPPVMPLWRHCNNMRNDGWITMYSDRLNAYPQPDCNRDYVDLGSSSNN